MKLPSPKILAASWTLLVLFACWSPGDTEPSLQILGFDKVAHATLFFVQCFLLAGALRGGGPDGTIPLLAVVVAGGLGALTEIGQIWVPNRTGSFWDFVADLLGILLCVALLWLWPKHLRRKKQTP